VRVEGGGMFKGKDEGEREGGGEGNGEGEENKAVFRSFFFTSRACLTITRVFVQSYNPAIPG